MATVQALQGACPLAQEENANFQRQIITVGVTAAFVGTMSFLGAIISIWAAIGMDASDVSLGVTLLIFSAALTCAALGIALSSSDAPKPMDVPQTVARLLSRANSPEVNLETYVYRLRDRHATLARQRRWTRWGLALLVLGTLGTPTSLLFM